MHLESNQLSSMGATLLVRGLMEGGCPLEELVIADNAITVSAEAQPLAPAPASAPALPQPQPQPLAPAKPQPEL